MWLVNSLVEATGAPGNDGISYQVFAQGSLSPSTYTYGIRNTAYFPRS
jgi:hypothetical protein